MEVFLQYQDLGLFILRAAVGIVFLYHSVPKIKNAQAMATAMGQPMGMVLMLGILELLGGLGLILGYQTQLSALVLAVIMIGALTMKSMKWGLPFSAQNKTGWEFEMVLFAAAIAILTGSTGSIGV